MTRHRLVAIAGGAVCAAATVAVVASAPDLSLAGESPAALAAEITPAALVALAAVAEWRSRFSPLAVGAVCAWLAAEWNSPGAGALFTAGLIVSAAWPALLAAAGLCGLDNRPLGRAGWAVVGVGLLAGVGVLGIASAAVFDPRGEACGGCPSNLVLIAGAPAVRHALGHIGLGLSAAWAAVFCCVAAARLVRASSARRRHDAPVLGPVAAVVALFGTDALHGIERGFVSNDPTDRVLRLAQAGALAMLAGGIALERLRLRRTRARVAQIVLDIGAAPTPGELRSRLAELLGDPALMILHPARAGWMDETGRELRPAIDGDRAITVLRAAGENVLAVVHRRGLLDDPQLVDELATTARLAIDHERLRAAHRARLDELRASRERIVAAADRERRTLERDLHDGAQQRLVTLTLSIRLARRQHPEHDAALAAAEDDVRSTVVAVREVAHGLFPTVLADEGLGAAIDVLSEQAPRLVARRLPDRRFPDAVESAAYFAASEALRLTEREVTVDAVAENGYLRLAIAADDTIEGAIPQIQDRVGAAGGTVVSRSGGLLLELPCES